MEQPKLETVKIASYILNHYDRNSHKDHLVLATYLEKWAIEFCERPPNNTVATDTKPCYYCSFYDRKIACCNLPHSVFDIYKIKIVIQCPSMGYGGQTSERKSY